MNEYNHIEIRISEGVAVVWLNRPEKRNAFNSGMISELTELFRDPELMKSRLVVIRGKGPAFCAGADLGYMKNIAAFGEEENYQDAMNLAALFQAVYTFEAPTLAAVHGACFGGANGLMAACDIVVAEEDTVFAFSEVRLGIAPATIAPYVMNRTGAYPGKELMLTGRRFTAQEAHHAGLVDKVAEPGMLEEAINEYVKSFRAAAPGAVRATKQLIHKITPPPGKELTGETARIIARLRASDEGQEGLSAFFEKRKPGWNNPE
ncbi:MAG: enoyl-CoA hydratase/isomerase family protein [Bacteroidales bacterium]